MESLSLRQARKLVLLSQRLPPLKQQVGGVTKTLASIEHLGYIQIDTISVVQRAHHHTLWNRNPGYTPSHLDQLMRKKRIFEYWSHAAAYLPMEDFRFTLPRKEAIRNGEQAHWYARNDKLMESVLQRIEQEGPLMAKDFESPVKKKGGWGRKPTKQALEYLFMQGELMVPHRVNFHKVYDLTERVLPTDVDLSMPSQEEYARYLITRFLQANGIGVVDEISYLQKNIKQQLLITLQEMVAAGELVELSVGGIKYHVLPESLELLKRPLKSQLKILSPFDNLIIQRNRIKNLFNYDYTLECYFPEVKRRFGYFSLPVLWKGGLVARMDCKVEKRNKRLHIKNFVLEDGMDHTDEFIAALCQELPMFLKFNGCEDAYLHKVEPEKLQPLVQAVIN